MLDQLKPSWTEEHVAELTRLWGSVSAKVIGERLGFTANAVIGKANRLHLRTLRVTATKSHKHAVKMHAANYEIDAITFKECQWLHGEPRDRNFCGEPVVANPDRRPYCAAHYPVTVTAKRIYV